jgi:hypothetical protein
MLISLMNCVMFHVCLVSKLLLVIYAVFIEHCFILKINVGSSINCRVQY